MRRALRQWPGVVAGLACGLAVAVLLGADSPLQQPPPSQQQPWAQNRYQLHVWSTEATTNGTAPRHGAYRIDGWTGAVWEIDEGASQAREIQFPQAAPAAAANGGGGH